jgi:hypothetical protein
MTRPTLTVETVHGTFTRQTARPYAFVIAARGERPEHIRRREETQRGYLVDGLAYALAQLAGERPIPAPYTRETRDDVLSDVARREHLLATWDEHLDALLAAEEAALLQPFADKRSEWSSRLDLARKAATKLRQWYRDVRIFRASDGCEVW